jgi:hypothetical protein
MAGTRLAPVLEINFTSKLCTSRPTYIQGQNKSHFVEMGSQPNKLDIETTFWKTAGGAELRVPTVKYGQTWKDVESGDIFLKNFFRTILALFNDRSNCSDYIA